MVRQNPSLAPRSLDSFCLGYPSTHPCCSLMVALLLLPWLQEKCGSHPVRASAPCTSESTRRRTRLWYVLHRHGRPLHAELDDHLWSLLIALTGIPTPALHGPKAMLEDDPRSRCRSPQTPDAPGRSGIWRVRVVQCYRRTCVWRRAVHMKKAGLSRDNTAFVGRIDGGTGRKKASQKMSCLYCRKTLDTSQVKTQRGAVDGSRL